MVRTDHFGKFTQTIALIAVGEGVVQLGSVNKVLSLSPSPPPLYRGRQHMRRMLTGLSYPHATLQ